MRTFALALVILAACPAARALERQSPANEQGTVIPSPDESLYRLGPGDALDIKFVRNPELNEQVQVRPDGYISMPLVGELSVATLTVRELVVKLTELFAPVLKSPSVVVQVREFANRRVFVGGEVGRPGVLPLVGHQTALGAVMEAGGMKSSANRGGLIVLRRGDEDVPRVIHLSLKSKDGAAPEASAFQLQPLDVVLVSESGVSRANRAVDQYVRQMVPLLLTAGFSYLSNASLFGVK
jgi:protein involved in polysaccharide export with SLBB domain